MSEFGENVRRIRIERHMSQKDLAAAVGVKQAAISAIELSTRLPSMPVAVAIANFLQITLDELNRPAVNRADTKAA